MCGPSAFEEATVMTLRINLDLLLEEGNQAEEEVIQDLISIVNCDAGADTTAAAGAAGTGEKKIGKEIKPIPHMYPLEIDKDFTDGVTRWRNRYLRDCPVHIRPNRRNTESGVTESFTLLAENEFAFTFSFCQSLEEMRKAEQELKRA